MVASAITVVVVITAVTPSRFFAGIPEPSVHGLMAIQNATRPLEAPQGGNRMATGVSGD
jgi:hypothetical protein